MRIDMDSLHRLISDRWLFFMADDESYVGTLQTIDIDMVRKGHYNFYQVTCMFHDRRQKPVLTFLLNEYGTIVRFTCSCRHREDDGCVHLIKAVKAINEINLDFTHLPIHVDYALYLEEKERKERERYLLKMLDESTQKAMDLMDQTNQQAYQDLFQEETKKLKLYCNVNLTSEVYPHLQLKVGQDRMYVIKNMQEFVQDVFEENEVRFGKNTYLHLDLSAFDEHGKKIFDFLNRHVWAREWRKEARIDSACLDDLYHLLKELPREMVSQSIQETESKLPVTMEEYDTYYTLYAPLDEVDYSGFLSGKREIYCVQEGTLRHWNLSRQACDLLREIDGGLNIRKEQFPDFYQDVIEPIQEELAIDADFDLSRLKQEITQIRIYADMEEGQVFVWGKYQLDGVDRDLFHGNSLRPVSLIEAIILRYADQKKDTMAIFKTKSKKLFAFLDEGLQKIQTLADVYVSDDLKSLQYRRSVSLQVGFHVNNDLLEIEMESDIDKKELMSILQAYRRRKSFHRLKNGELIDLQNQDLQQLDQLVREYDLSKEDFEKEIIERPAYQVLKEDDSLAIRKDASVQTYIDRLNSIQDETFSLPEKYDGLLRDYQKEGVQWMKHLYDIGLNGILADDMGLGKTLQVLCLLDCFIDKEKKQSLIVCPSSLMFNWESEIEKFQVDIDAVCVYGPQSERKKRIEQAHDLYITTYDYIKRDQSLYEKKSFEYMILDEAQFIKNPKTKNAKSVKAIPSKHRLALTGTPIENRLSELWSIFDFLLPGYLYSLSYFMKEIERPIELEQDEKKQAMLKKMVSPFILRRTKKEVLDDLPDKIERNLWLDFDPEEKKLYLANLAQVNLELQQQLKMDTVDSIAILAMMTKLRQICCEPRMVYQNIHKPSTKLEMCVDLIKTLKENKKKVLLFSSFTKVFDWLIEAFAKEGISYHLLTGSTSKEKRKEEVDAFQNDDSDVFLISLKAGGTGLNLTQASAVIHFDPWWNSSAQSQATDRAYRIGQNQNVIVYQLLMRNSIEAKINDMQQKKQEMSDLFVENSGPMISRMSAQDLKDLFSM